MVQHPPQLRLEQNNQRQQSDGQKLIDDEAQGIQVHHVRQGRNDHHDDHSPGHPDGAGRTDQGQ